MASQFIFPGSVTVHPLVILKAEQAKAKILAAGEEVVCILLGTESDGSVYVTNAFPLIYRDDRGELDDHVLNVMSSHYTSIYEGTWVVGWLSFKHSKTENLVANKLFVKFKSSRFVQIIYEGSVAAKMWMNIGLNHQLLVLDSSIPNGKCSVGSAMSNETIALKSLGLVKDSGKISELLAKSEVVGKLDAQDVYTILNASSGSLWPKNDKRDEDIRELAEAISSKK